MNMFLFKPDLDSQGFQVPDGTQKIYGVPGKTLDGFCQNKIDFPLFGIFQHPLEFLPFLYPST